MMLSLSTLQDRLHYNPETGVFTWLKVKGGGMHPGDVAGCKDIDCIRIGIEGKEYPAHVLAKFYIDGVWPPQLVDHKDLNPFNNRYNNLRDATKVENGRNCDKRKHNTSGYKGVAKTSVGRWRAYAVIDCKQVHIGCYATPELASAARTEYTKQHYGEFHRA